MTDHARSGRRPGAAGADLPRAGRRCSRRWPSTSPAQGRALRRCPPAPVRPGATPMVDIDGGIGTVFSYALQGHPRAAQRHRRARRPAEQLGREGTFLGQHVYTSRPGVAVQINAFNFPVWGMLEKLAPGVPRRAADHRQAGQPDGVPHRARRTPRSSSPACCPRAPCSCSAAARRACSRSSAPRTPSPSPARPRPAPTCASTRRCCTAASSSASRPTR